MSLFGRPTRIKHPDWMENATKGMESSVRLYRQGCLPPGLDVPMLVVPCRYILRSIYGSDLRACIALLREAMQGLAEDLHGVLWRFWHFRVLMESPDRTLNEMMDKGEEDADA